MIKKILSTFIIVSLTLTILPSTGFAFNNIILNQNNTTKPPLPGCMKQDELDLITIYNNSNTILSNKIITSSFDENVLDLIQNINENIYVYRPVGCKKCKNKGYTGRTGLYEVLEMTRNLAEIVSKNPTEGDILKEARAQGMVTMEEDGVLKVLEGITSLEEIMRVTKEI